MSESLQLQQKLRRSEVLSEQDIYKDFMRYAKQVSDEINVYIYMQENHIGTNITQYWLARFAAMRSRCQMTSLVELVSSVKAMPEIEVQKIDEYEHRLYLDFQKIIHGSFRGRRKVSQFSQHQKETLHPSRRKIGNIEVYVDEPCRRNYYLQDYAKFIEEEMEEYCLVERQDYERKQAKKPLSFLAKKQKYLMDLAEDLLSKNYRKSLHDRNSIGLSRRTSHFMFRKTQNVKDEDYNTPKNNDSKGKKHPEQSQKTKSLVKVHNRDASRDSVQILKEMKQKEALAHKSPSFKCNEPNQGFNVNIFEKSFPIEERCRNTQDVENQIFGFSFGKKGKPRSQYKVRQVRRNATDDEKDNAFIAYSFSHEKSNKSSEKTTTNQLRVQDFEFDLLIQECRKEKYEFLESQTFSSQIDSNQENKEYFDKIKRQKQKGKDRKPFEVLLQTDSNHIKEMSSIDLEYLVQFDDDDKNPELCESMKKPQCSMTERKPRVSPMNGYRSQQKRLSNIAEEPSHFSDSRQKHSKN